MSDDLAKRLDNLWSMLEEEGFYTKANTVTLSKSHIEELEDELHLMKTAGIIEVAIRNPSVSEYIVHWERRAEGAEAKLEKAVKALTDQVEYHKAEANWWDEACNDLRKAGHNAQAEFLRKTIAELKGQDHRH